MDQSNNKPVRSITDQTVEIIRKGIEEGRWRGFLPGRVRLSRELGVSDSTVWRACKILIENGAIEKQGLNRKNKIRDFESTSGEATFRTVLFPLSEAFHNDQSIVCLGYEVEKLGMELVSSLETLEGLHFNLGKIKKDVESRRADALIIQGGNSQILTWASEIDIPTFAFGGPMRGKNIAGAGFDAQELIESAVEKLLGLGHTRIVFLDYIHKNTSELDYSIELFLESLTSHGIAVGRYHYPLWDIDQEEEGLRDRLEQLFKHTPPTAIFFRDATTYRQTQAILRQMGFETPKDISLVCLSYSIHFEKDLPHPTYGQGDPRDCVPAMIQWIKNVKGGVHDLTQTRLPMKLVLGDSIAPPHSSSK